MAGRSTRSRPSSAPIRWDVDVASWIARARRGPGVLGQYGSKTAYFWAQRTWGGTIVGPCAAPKPKPGDKPPKGGKHGDKPPKGGGAGGGGGGAPPPPPPPTP